MRRMILTLAGSLLCMVAAPGAASAQATRPAGSASFALVDAPLRTLLSGAAGAASWTPIDDVRVSERLCETGAEVRVAMSLAQLGPSARTACRQLGRTVLFQKTIGWVIVTPVARAGGAYDLTSAQLYKALAVADDLPRPAKWTDIDAALPDSPVRVLLPVAGSLEDRALAATALLRGCIAVRGQKLPAAGEARVRACSPLRADAAVARAQSAQMASAWLRTAPAGAVAFVGYGQLAADSDLTAVMTLDGRLAMGSALLTSEYPGALPVYALATRASGGSEARRDAAVAVADALLSESAIGPQGGVAVRGLAPLPAPDRVALRSAFAQFLTKTGVWE